MSAWEDAGMVLAVATSLVWPPESQHANSATLPKSWLDTLTVHIIGSSSLSSWVGLIRPVILATTLRPTLSCDRGPGLVASPTRLPVKYLVTTLITESLMPLKSYCATCLKPEGCTDSPSEQKMHISILVDLSATPPRSAPEPILELHGMTK